LISRIQLKRQPLSLAERIGFDLGFLVAGIASVWLLATNAGWIFAGRRQGFRALAIFGLFYLLIYILLRIEPAESLDTDRICGYSSHMLVRSIVRQRHRKFVNRECLPSRILSD